MRATNARRMAAVVGAFVLSGCYKYVPAERPAPGTQVRVQVPVRSSVGSSDGDPELVPFEGTLVTFGDTLLLQTRTHRVIGTHREYVTMDTIRVLRSEYRGLEERVISRPRTALFSAAMVGGAVLLVAALEGLTGSEGEDDKGGNGGTPQGSVVTDRPGWRIFGFRIPIPWPSG